MKVTFSDLRSIDHFCCQFLDGLRDAEDNGINEENFESIIFEHFTTSLSDGSHVDLKPDGASIPVTYVLLVINEGLANIRCVGMRID